MRVLRIVHNLGVGGVQRQLLKLAPLMLEEMELDICTFTPNGELEPSFRNMGVRIHHMDIEGAYNPWRIAQLIKFIKNGGYHLVHVHRMGSIVFPAVVAALVAGVTVVVHHHFIYDWSNSRKRFLEAVVTGRCAGVLSVSHPVKEHSCEELTLHPQKVRVLTMAWMCTCHILDILRSGGTCG